MLLDVEVLQLLPDDRGIAGTAATEGVQDVGEVLRVTILEIVRSIVWHRRYTCSFLRAMGAPSDLKPSRSLNLRRCICTSPSAMLLWVGVNVIRVVAIS